MCKKRKITLVGIGPGEGAFLTPAGQKVIQESTCVIGAPRMLEAVRMLLSGGSGFPEKMLLKSYKPDEICTCIQNLPASAKVAVLLSGDPGFYSAARLLLERLAQEEVDVVPGISAVVYLATRLHTGWEDAALLSVHGRKQNYIQVIASCRKTFLLLGAEGCGEEICGRIKEYRLEHVVFFIGKQLSYEGETIVRRPAGELVSEDLEGLCTVMVLNPSPRNLLRRSIPDREWIRGKVPMTKEEVRTVSIGKLHLTEHAVLYDIGAGTGSVSVEAALWSETIRVYAVERNPEAAALLLQNKRKFCTDWVEIVEGCAPEALEELPAPTHVFIGGSGGNLRKIISCVRKKNPSVRIVLTALSLETLKEAILAAEEGLMEEPEVVQVSVSKSVLRGAYHLMEGQNPVYILSFGGEEEFLCF